MSGVQASANPVLQQQAPDQAPGNSSQQEQSDDVERERNVAILNSISQEAFDQVVAAARQSSYSSPEFSDFEAAAIALHNKDPIVQAIIQENQLQLSDEGDEPTEESTSRFPKQSNMVGDRPIQGHPPEQDGDGGGGEEEFRPNEDGMNGGVGTSNGNGNGIASGSGKGRGKSKRGGKNGGDGEFESEEASKDEKGKGGDTHRKSLHKEVERRRREAINEGITRLSQIVPGCEPKTTHKGMIIQKAVAYIETLKADEVSNIEKWTFEKLLMDEAMAGLKDQLADAHRQIQTLREEREVLMGAGVGNENGGRDYIDGDGEDRKRMRL